MKGKKEEFENADLSPEELFERLARDPMDREDMTWDSRWAVFDDDNQTMLSALITIPYQAWFDRYNFITNDEDIEYIWVKRASPFLNNVYSYIYYSAGGEPMAYMTYRAKREAGIHTLAEQALRSARMQGTGSLKIRITDETMWRYIYGYHCRTDSAKTDARAVSFS